MECEHCKNIFSALSSLKYHQKTAKYCLKIRGVKSTSYKCEYCSKQLSTKQHLDIHKLNCKSKHKSDIENKYKHKLKKAEEEILQLKITIKELRYNYKHNLEKIALKAVSKPVNINQTTNNNQKINTMINNLVPISDKHFEENAKYLTLDHIKRGAEGYAEYALAFPLKNRVACVDYSRKKIKYKEEGGEGEDVIVSDPGMFKLSVKLFSAINERNIGLISKHTNELTQLMFDEPDKDEEGETKELSDKEVEKSIKSGEMIVGNIFRLRSQVFDVQEGANGTKTDLYHKLVNHVCSKTVY
jgi:hypothetical protein